MCSSITAPSWFQLLNPQSLLHRIIAFQHQLPPFLHHSKLRSRFFSSFQSTASLRAPFLLRSVRLAVSQPHFSCRGSSNSSYHASDQFSRTISSNRITMSKHTKIELKRMDLYNLDPAAFVLDIDAIPKDQRLSDFVIGVLMTAYCNKVINKK